MQCGWNIAQGSTGIGLCVLGICAAVTLVVFGVMIHAIVSFRANEAGVTRFAHNTATEIVWALIPMLILIGTAIPAVNAWLAESGCAVIRTD